MNKKNGSKRRSRKRRNLTDIIQDGVSRSLNDIFGNKDGTENATYRGSEERKIIPSADGTIDIVTGQNIPRKTASERAFENMQKTPPRRVFIKPSVNVVDSSLTIACIEASYPIDVIEPLITDIINNYKTDFYKFVFFTDSVYTSDIYMRRKVEIKEILEKVENIKKIQSDKILLFDAAYEALKPLEPLKEEHLIKVFDFEEDKKEEIEELKTSESEVILSKADGAEAKVTSLEEDINAAILEVRKESEVTSKNEGNKTTEKVSFLPIEKAIEEAEKQESSGKGKIKAVNGRFTHKNVVKSSGETRLRDGNTEYKIKKLNYVFFINGDESGSCIDKEALCKSITCARNKTTDMVVNLINPEKIAFIASLGFRFINTV